MSKNLGGLGDNYGEVSLFGLDEFGAPVGLNPAWGGLVGAGVQTGAAIAVRQMTSDPKWYKWSELLGAGIAALASAPLIFFEGTRAAGWTGLAAGVVSGGLRQLEMSFSKKGQALQAIIESSGLGIATIYPAEIPGRLNGSVMVQPLGVPLSGASALSGHFGTTAIG